MKALLPALALLLLAAPSFAQLVRLTPDVAKGILGMAQNSRAEANSASAAVRDFKKAFQKKYAAWPGCDRYPAQSLSSPVSVGEEAADRPAQCVYSPAAWYGEQLLRALAHEADFAAIEPVDALVVLIAPKKAIRGTKQTVTIRQGDAVNQEVTFEGAKTITPVRQELKSIEFVEGTGEIARRTAWVWFFKPDLLDMNKFTEITWWLDEQTHGTHGISAMVMKNMR